MKVYDFKVILEPDEEAGGYVASRRPARFLKPGRSRVSTPGKPGRSEPHAAILQLFQQLRKSINKAYGRTGSLFQKRFGRILVTSDGYFTALVRYIHFNPQKHGFGDFREYPYSSYQAMLSDKATRLKRDVVLEWFGDRAAFVEFHEDLPGRG